MQVRAGGKKRSFGAAVRNVRAVKNGRSMRSQALPRAFGSLQNGAVVLLLLGMTR